MGDRDDAAGKGVTTYEYTEVEPEMMEAFVAGWVMDRVRLEIVLPPT